MPRPVAKMKPLSILLLTAMAGSAAPASAQRRLDQDAAYQGLRAGSIMPLRDIEARFVPGMAGAAYLGPELDAGSAIYRLKFMRGGKVIWIDVDARSGRELGRSGR